MGIDEGCRQQLRKYLLDNETLVSAAIAPDNTPARVHIIGETDRRFLDCEITSAGAVLKSIQLDQAPDKIPAILEP
jgi:hypothetical protein